MNRRIAITVVVGILVGMAIAVPDAPARPRQTSSRHHRKATPTAKQGSGSGSGSAAGGASDGSAATGPGPGSGSGTGTSGGANGGGSGAAVEADSAVGSDDMPAGPATRPLPPPAPRLAMRAAEPAHGGFVDQMDCSACHTADGWKLSVAASSSGFDHDRTGFPLRGAHVQATCGRCHTGKASPPTNCDGCHNDPHQGRMDGTCAECHTATAWSDTATLEQHRRTRMPLTGKHAIIACTACHARQTERRFSDTPTDCYACHAAEYHATHSHDGSRGFAAPFSRDCALCHQTTAWQPAFVDPTVLLRTGPAARIEHDAWFTLSTGSHRTAECSACHSDVRRARAVRCDGCHQDTTLRTQHGGPVARTAATCLACHPRGAMR